MDLFVETPIRLILFFIFYGVTGTVPLFFALYLLFRRGNAFAPDVTPPLRLRRWTAAFFSVSVLSHVWWYLFYIYSREILSLGYVVVVLLDCVLMTVTIAGTLLSMLQDRRRPVWPALVAMIPFLAILAALIVYPREQLKQLFVAYVVLLYIVFATYMVFAVRRYERWLNDNYADLENKKLWMIQAVSIGCLLLLIFYALADIGSWLIYFMHAMELLLFILLLWRVETLPDLSPALSPREREAYSCADEKPVETPYSHADEKEAEAHEPAGADTDDDDTLYSPLPGKGLGNEALAQIEQLLSERCVATQLYLQHDLSLLQLARAIGTNRSYLSQYFSRQGITYNTYINNLRINHFISRYQELTQAGQPVVAQQLASESGYRSYSTFSLAFKQRTGQSVTAWTHDTEAEAE